MSGLKSLRTKIDALDTELLRLLNERATLAQQIGEIKNREGRPVYAPERENQLLRSLVERSDGPLKPESIRAIYCEIMSASLALEKNIAIVCPGPAGSPSHQAARSKFGSSVRYTFAADVAKVLQQVREEEADCGVIPINDPEVGLANPTLDQLAQAEDFSICAEIYLTPEGQDNDQAAARFFVIGRSTNPPSGHDLTMLMLRVEDKPGALVSALEPFKSLNINLDHLASRPASRGSDDVFFFVEASGHTQDQIISDLLRELSKRCRAVKVLGSYPETSS